MSPDLAAQTHRLLGHAHLNAARTASDAVWWAVAALESGYDTETLRMLAAEYAATAFLRNVWLCAWAGWPLETW